MAELSILPAQIANNKRHSVDYVIILGRLYQTDKNTFFYLVGLMVCPNKTLIAIYEFVNLVR